MELVVGITPRGTTLDVTTGEGRETLLMEKREFCFS
jgi:hypothetical protein